MKAFLITQLWFTVIVLAEVVKWYAAARLVAMYGGWFK